MRKLLLIAAVIAAVVVPVIGWAAVGTCTESVVKDSNGNIVTITFVCTGGTDGDAGTVATQTVSSGAMALIKDKTILYSVTAFPTSGGTAPDAADVTVLQDGQDMLGGKGVNLIHATATYTTPPYSAFMADYFFPSITNTVTMAIANEATASCNFTIKLVFLKL